MVAAAAGGLKHTTVCLEPAATAVAFSTTVDPTYTAPKAFQ